MSNNAVVAFSTSETKWTVTNGAMKGAVRLMEALSFTIGRSPECEFVIVSDPKCSRKHAFVEWTARGCQIASLNEQNLVLINGKARQNAILNDNDIVVIGETEVQFNLTTLPTVTRGSSDAQRPAHLSVMPDNMLQNYVTPESRGPAKRQSPRSSKTKKPSSKVVLYAIMGIVALFVLLPSGKKKKEEQQLRTEKQAQADIDAANKLQDAANNSLSHRLDQSITARQAQENFVRGFRDYRKGQFERSLDSFQACLALDPAHSLCNRYIRLAQRKFNEIVQYNIVLGRQYRDQNQFQACRSAFRNVMVMVKDSNSAPYKEAKANYDACNAFLEGRF